MFKNLFNYLLHSSTAGFVVFVIVGLVVVYKVQQDNLRETNRAFLTVCERDNNDLRRQLNDLGGITRDFMRDAAESRQRQADLANIAGNKKEQAINQEAADKYRRAANAFKDIRYIDCKATLESGRTIYQRG